MVAGARCDCVGTRQGGQHGEVPPPPEPTLALAQARARWGEAVAVAALFRPGPDPEARTALTRAVSRRTNRRRSRLPTRLLVAIDEQGRALVCPYVADPQGGHPEGDDLYDGPFDALGAVAAGPLTIVVLLDATWAAVLEAVWLDHDAAVVAALLTGEPLPEPPDAPPEPVPDQAADEPSAYTDALLAQAEAAQARADMLRALAAAAQAEEAGEGERPPG